MTMQHNDVLNYLNSATPDVLSDVIAFCARRLTAQLNGYREEIYAESSLLTSRGDEDGSRALAEIMQRADSIVAQITADKHMTEAVEEIRQAFVTCGLLSQDTAAALEIRKEQNKYTNCWGWHFQEENGRWHYMGSNLPAALREVACIAAELEAEESLA